MTQACSQPLNSARQLTWFKWQVDNHRKRVAVSTPRKEDKVVSDWNKTGMCDVTTQSCQVVWNPDSGVSIHTTEGLSHTHMHTQQQQQKSSHIKLKKNETLLVRESEDKQDCLPFQSEKYKQTVAMWRKQTKIWTPLLDTRDMLTHTATGQWPAHTHCQRTVTCSYTLP